MSLSLRQISLLSHLKSALARLRWCNKLWDITSLESVHRRTRRTSAAAAAAAAAESVQVVGFFDVAARLCAGDGPIAALVGGSSCSIGSALQHRAFNDYKNSITFTV